MGKIELNLFKVEENFTYQEIQKLLKNKLNDKKNEKYLENKLTYTLGTHNFKICGMYMYTKNNFEKKLWEKKIFNLFKFDEDEVLRVAGSSYGYIIIGQDKRTYVISFGRANKAITEFIDENFGLEMAAKILDGKSVNVQSSKFYALSKNKSIIEFSNAGFDREIGEAVDGLVGKIKEIPGYQSVKNLLNIVSDKVNFTTSIKLNIEEDKVNIENLCKIISYIDNIKNNYPENNILIPRLTKVTDLNLIENLKNELNNQLLSGDYEGNIYISFYELKDSKFVFRDDISKYTLSFNRKKLFETEDLDVSNIVKVMKSENIGDIESLNVKIEYVNGETERKKALQLIDYTLQAADGTTYYSLNNGKWYKYNEKFLNVIETELAEVKKIITFDKEYDCVEEELEKFKKENEKELDKIMKIPYRELIYNFKLSKEYNGILCDRKDVGTDRLEVCDIYTNNDGLIHVKIGSPDDFIKCMNQSKNGILEYKGNNERVKNKLGIGDTECATLLLITTNKNVIENNDISKFNSLKLKINLIDWYRFVGNQKFVPKIIIAEKR